MTEVPHDAQVAVCSDLIEKRTASLLDIFSLRVFVDAMDLHLTGLEVKLKKQEDEAK